MDSYTFAAPVLVAIGTSAGGLSALERFFSATPAKTGACFVVIQHLSPHYPSHMSELLARFTSMRVRQVSDGDELIGDQVLLIPPGKELVLEGRNLRLHERGDELPSHPIDVFFSSIARYGSRVAGVVLTGTGSDGSRGLCEIHNAGGVVFVQDPETAEFPGMPSSAIKVVQPTLTGAPAELAMGIQSWLQGGSGGRSGLGDAYESLLRIVRDRSGVDFSLYKQATILRRVERRMGMSGVKDVSDYLSLVSGDTAEVAALVDDLLIGVTGFFRDGALFDRLRREVLPLALEEASTQGQRDFRVWVPGCASGPEAYSLAMLLDEAASAAGFAGQLRIFATDAHQGALETASAGIYSKEEFAAVPEDLRTRYTATLADGRLRVASALRELIVFAPHNVLADPPFTRINLLSCRNLLIYFDSAAQEVALGAFRYSLVREGLLVLGSSEGVSGYKGDFRALDTKLKIFRKVRGGGGLPNLLGRPSARHGKSSQPAERVEPPRHLGSVDPRLLTDYDHILSQCQISGLLLDEHGTALHLFGDASELLQFGGGRVQGTTVELLPEEMRARARSLVQRAALSRQVCRAEPIGVTINNHAQRVEMIATPLAHRTGEAHVLLSFRRHSILDQAQQAAPGAAEAKDEYRHYIEDLELEVKATRENLQATIEELQTTVEELQSTNEELQSSNEELQSSNEELQSSNEELQSVNEELHTVNSEYEQKNEVLQSLNRDLESLLDSTDIGIVFVDSDGCVRRFNRAAQRAFRLAARDLGRRLSDISSDFSQDVNIHGQLQQVLREQQPIEFPAAGRQGSHYLVFIQPYRHRDGERGAQAVLTMTDVSRVKALEERVQHAHRLASIGRLAGGVAHDFNNILAGIQGNAELIGATPLAEESQAAVSAIFNATRRAATLTGSLLSFGRKAPTQMRAIDLHTLLPDVANLARSKLRSTVTVKTHFAADCAVVRGDAGQLQAVFLNLILNANDAMTFGGKITIQTAAEALDSTGRTEGEVLLVSVADQGPGMPEEVHKHVFEPYYTTKGLEGNGLGLAAALGTIEEHGGSIQFDTVEGTGTTFTVRLPLRRDLVPRHEASVLPARPTRPRNASLLVAEDDPNVRSMLRRLTRSFGYEVHAVETGTQAIAAYKTRGAFDLVLLDVTMPGISGPEVFRVLREIDPRARVVMMSGNAHEAWDDALRAEGLMGFLHKPFEGQELDSVLARALSPSSAAQAGE